MVETPITFENCSSSAAFTLHFRLSSPPAIRASTSSGSASEAFEVRNTYGKPSSPFTQCSAFSSSSGAIMLSPR